MDQESGKCTIYLTKERDSNGVICIGKTVENTSLNRAEICFGISTVLHELLHYQEETPIKEAENVL
jgi:hypothetical protein